MPKGHFRLFALLGGGIVLVVALAGFWRVQNQPVNATWTPAQPGRPLRRRAAVSGVFAAAAPQKAVADKRLTVATDAGPKVVLEATVRVNNADQILAARFTPLLVLSAVAGGAFALFVIGLFAPRIGAFHQHGLIDLHLTA